MNLSGKVIKETTTMTVYKRLCDFVLNGQFPPGEWIRERQLKELLGVSSTPIREALRMLVQERILESIPHHGVRVKDLSVKEIEDYYQLRAELEGLAAELAAERGNILFFEKMEIIINKEREKDEATYFASERVESNNEFHDLIVEASDNQALKNMLTHLRTGINWIQIRAWNLNKDRHFTTHNQHQKILEALMARDGKVARSRMVEHIWDSVHLILHPSNTEKETKAVELLR
ncbi:MULTISPECIES: GntR family transcriptional regulator [unclassified Paenibacillus]|uniref:GntR family transcriptional regulator n=1 Tax=unclassified Paenibacillus TaxID=185978 RepID=UPI001AE41305|nr:MULTISPECIES: GntR family transcriptional regulator [unclassified Paenibacillus]MBP1154452.1 DNA-binding GntR family transcriptional regulator [Paenibacillus sp. PvP091]MBP1170164.1 DNA-binding GntR family transcriptional regulator [Paenibacillus sp. PvR098]MBP2441192.1 DNA-binding GntR family transcriptional regulator [Paenibacillus sp. PvP052]